MSLAMTIKAMVAAGCSVEQIAAVADQFAEHDRDAIAAKRAKDAERKRKSRASSVSHGQAVTPRTYCDIADNSSEQYIARAGAPVCSNDISNEISKLDNPLPTVGPLKPKNPTPQKILSEVVSEKTAADVVAHRKALRKPLTPRAAELLAKSLAASGDAEHAAATMIERGWQGYRADWDSSKPNARAGPNGRGGFATLLAESLADSHVERTEKKRTSEIVQLLPIGEHDRSGAGGDHDGGVSRNAVEVLVGNSFRRM